MFHTHTQTERERERERAGEKKNLHNLISKLLPLFISLPCKRKLEINWLKGNTFHPCLHRNRFFAYKEKSWSNPFAEIR